MESSDGADDEAWAPFPEFGDCAKDWEAATRVKEIEKMIWQKYQPPPLCQTLGRRTVTILRTHTKPQWT
jgi:hypothetical protein